jgi:hypothetical protein
MAHAVEQGQDRGVRSDRRRKGVDRPREVIGLAAQQDEVERLAQTLRRHGRRRRQVHVAHRAADRKAGAGELARAPRAHQECHVAAGLQQPAAEIAADTAGANHENTHGASANMSLA